MNDLPHSPKSETSILEKAQLVQWHDEATAAAAEPDLRERVQALTFRALNEHRMSLDEVRETVRAITSGVGSGLVSRGGDIRQGLHQAVAGLDDALGSTAQEISYALRETVGQGRAFKENELRARLEQLRDLESSMLETLKETASESGGKLKVELGILSGHLKHNGTRTGEQVREALQQLARGLKSSTHAGRAGLNASASAATERLSLVASGVLAALADTLKHQSERLRP